MLKKIFMVALFGALAVVSVSAQTRVDNFTGTWKSTKLEGSIKDHNVQSLTLNVTQAAGDLQIEQTTQAVYQKRDYSRTQSSSYKLDGSTSTDLRGGQSLGALNRYLKVTGADKLMLRYNIQTDGNGEVGTTEFWTLSDDGKTLTVELRAKYGFSKITYSRQ
jgi:hypothetical protein